MVAFTIGSISVYRYGIAYFVSFIVGYFFLRYIGHTQLFNSRPHLQNLLENGSEDIILFALIGVMIGGRLGHILIYSEGYYFLHPLEFFAFWKGGMSFIGGMIGVLASFLLLKKIKRLSRTDILLVFDCILTIVPFGIMIGRIANYFNQELYGTIVPGGLTSKIGYPLFSILHDLNIFHIYPAIDNLLRINTNFISSFFEGLMLLIITLITMFRWIQTKKYHAGQITGLFLVFYSIIRFLLEYIRDDSQREYLLMFTKSQRFFIGFFILGIYFLLRSKLRKN